MWAEAEVAARSRARSGKRKGTGSCLTSVPAPDTDMPLHVPLPWPLHRCHLLRRLARNPTPRGGGDKGSGSMRGGTSGMPLLLKRAFSTRGEWGWVPTHWVGDMGLGMVGSACAESPAYAAVRHSPSANACAES